MGRRSHSSQRCVACRMHEVLCICALTPRLETRTRLVLVLHKEEEKKTTNTGRLAARCLVNSSVVIVGDLKRPLPTSLVEPGQQPLFLFPDDDARPISDFAASDKPVTLIVPDGNWRQAGKMRARVPGLASVPCVSLPDGPATSYRLRAEQRPGGLATLEAIARAFAVLEGSTPADAMLAVFRVMVDRTLWSRGALKEDEVSGGIPPDAALDRLRGGVVS